MDDPEVIVFDGEHPLPPIGAMEGHKLGDRVSSLFGVAKKEVQADWEKVVGQMQFLLEQVSAVTKDYELTEMIFELGFSAEGKIVFVAKAGVTTSISAKFTRK
jgi:hypothetical protein